MNAPADPFGEALARVEERLDLPYPDRAELLDELAADLEAAYLAFRERGLGEAEARDAALREVSLDPADLAALADVHRPAARRALDRLPARARTLAAPAALAFPFLALLWLLSAKVPLVLFLREGGAAVAWVLALGALALFLELRRFFVWFVLRDHGPAALAEDTPAPLYLAAGAALAGLGGTALGYHAVLARWEAGLLAPGALRAGLREPLACAVTGCALATLTVLLHGALAAGLSALRVPRRKGGGR